MATGSLYGSVSESTGLYGIGAASGGTYFEWFIFYDSATAPATPTGGSWSFTTNTGTAPTGWLASPPTSPVNQVWVSLAIVDSRSTSALTWTTPGLMSSFGNSVANYLTFVATSAPTYSAGRLWYDTTQKAFAYYNDVTGNVVHVGQETQLKVHNNTGATITKGAPVYVTSTSSGNTFPNIALAQANTLASANCIGLVNQDIANGADGYVVIAGLLTAANTGTFTVGDVLYLSPYSAGQLMNTVPPTGYAVRIGVVSYANTPNGSIYVNQSNVFAQAGNIVGTVAIANGGTGATTASAARTSLGLGTLSTQDASNVAITGGSISLTTALPIASGGTAGTTAATARSSLGAVGLSDTQTLTNKTISGASNTLTNIPNSSLNNSTFSMNGQVFTLGAVQTVGANLFLPSYTGNAGKVLALNPSASDVQWISAGGVGTVTSIDISGGTTGLTTFGGPITAAGTITLGGTLAVANGGTGAGTAATARTNLGATTVGSNMFALTNPSAITFPRFNADNTVSALDAAAFRTAIGAGTGAGSVTSVAATVPSFLSVSGSPITSSGTLAVTLSGTALPTTSGGTGLTSFTANGVVYASSTSALTTGSALTFDGTNLVVGYASAGNVIAYTGGSIKVNRADNATNNEIKYVTSGDLFYFNQANGGAYQFNITGSEQMRLTSTGLGIGTSSPYSKLSVEGDINLHKNANNTIVSYTGAAYTNLQYDAATHKFFVSGSTAATIDSSGNLGIGTSSPGQKLDVVGKIRSTVAGGGTHLLMGNSYATVSIGSAQNASLDADLTFYTQTSTERMRLDYNGNLGLGVTPSAWSIGKSMQIGSAGDASILGYGNGSYLSANAYYNSGWLYKATAAAAAYWQTNGAHSWQIAASGTAGNAITFTQAMTLAASGRLLVGTTTEPSGGVAKLAIYSTSGGGFQLIGSSNTGGAAQSAIDGGGQVFYTYTGSTGSESYTERARIDSSGNLLVGTTSTDPAGNNVSGVAIRTGAATSIQNGSSTALALGTSANNTYLQVFRNASSLAGYISVTGTVTTYNSISDYRLKENVQPMEKGLETISQLKPCTYDWVLDKTQGKGFIAHELQAVIPEAVQGQKDLLDEDGNPLYQGIDVSMIVPYLVKAIQELKADFDAYKASHP